MDTTNPLLSLHDLADFDAIRPEHVEPAMRALLDDAARRRAMGGRAAAYYASKFGRDRGVRRIVDIVNATHSEETGGSGTVRANVGQSVQSSGGLAARHEVTARR